MSEAFDYSNPTYWEDLVQRGPLVALDAARTVIDRGDTSADARLLARRAASRSLFELGRLPEAVESARATLANGQDASDEIRWAATMTAAIILAEAGDVDLALGHLGRLAAHSDGVSLGRVRLQTACVLMPAGRIDEALTELDQSEMILAEVGDAGDLWRIHHNRGYALLQLGRLDAADADFEAAQDIALRHGMTMAAAQTHANRGVLHGRARRLVLSIDHFDTASQLFADCGEPGRAVAWTEIDRAEVMMLLGLVADAVDAADRAVAMAGETGNQWAIGDAQLVLARAQLAARRVDAAAHTAATAAELFDATGREQLVSHARSVGAQARLEQTRTEDAGRAGLIDTAPLVAELAERGWHDQQVDLMHRRVVKAHRWGLWDLVEDDLLELRGGSGEGRARELARRLAEAIFQYREGDPVAARSAAVSGLDQLDEIVAEARTLEERSAAISLGADLSQIVIEVSLDLRDADTVFAAAEGTRARALHDELHDAYRHRPLSADGAGVLRRELAGRLGDRTLVEWVVARGRVYAVVIDRTGPRLIDVADEREVTRSRDRILVSLDMAASEPDESSMRATRAARALDELLIPPLGLPDAEGIVVVPVGLLHEVPWAGLPSLAARWVSLAPSAQLWLEADRRANGGLGRIGLISGPDIEAAALERAAITTHYGTPAIAEGAGATPESARSMFGGYDLVHVAAHGKFRSDRPLLSTLRLEGGEATMYDAVPDRIGARLIVLSSCEGGAQGAADGSEVLGLSAVMLARGAASVVAPLTVVRDLECAEFVAEFHAEFAKGEPVAQALANVRQRWLSDDDLSRWAVASSFICFGSGRTHLPR